MVLFSSSSPDTTTCACDAYDEITLSNVEGQKNQTVAFTTCGAVAPKISSSFGPVLARSSTLRDPAARHGYVAMLVKHIVVEIQTYVLMRGLCEERDEDESGAARVVTKD